VVVAAVVVLALQEEEAVLVGRLAKGVVRSSLQVVVGWQEGNGAV
jgi:hypothetical protein